MTQVNQATTQIKREFETHRAELISLYSHALEETLHTNSSTFQPALVPELAAAEAEALLNSLAGPQAMAIAERGRQLCDHGLSEESVLALERAVRQYTLTCLDSSLHIPALAALDCYYDPLQRAFWKQHQQTELEQEQLRTHQQKNTGSYPLLMQLASDIARISLAPRDVNDLLQRSISALADALHPYFAGIFLLDDYRQWAVLRAAAGDMGHELISRGYRKNLNQDSPITEAIKSRKSHLIASIEQEPRAVLDLLLPDVRSAVISPLLLQDVSVGALVVQSDQEGAFTENDLPIFRVISDQLSSALENVRLYAQVQASLQAAELARSQDVEQKRGETGEQSVVYLYDLNQDDFHTVPDWSPVAAVEADPSIPAATVERAAETSLSVPVILRDQTLGTIELYDLAEPRSWSDNEIALANAVASQAALALDNARLYDSAQLELAERKRAEEETLRRNAQLATLYELGQRLASINDPVEIARTVHNMLGRVMDNTNFYIAYYDEALSTVSFPVYTIDGVFHDEPPRPFGGGLTEYVIGTKNPLIVLENIDETFDRLGVARRGRLSQSLVAVPLMSGDRVLGVMTMQDYYRSNAYSAPDIALFSAVASAVSSFLENARLYSALSTELTERQRAQAELQRRLRETLLLNKVSGKAAAEREAQLVLETVCHDLTEFFGAILTSVGLFDEGNTKWEIIVDYNTEGNPSGRGLSVPLQGLPIFEEILRTRSAFYSPDTHSDPRVTPIRAYLQSRHSRSLLLAPLIILDQVVGAISISKPQPNGFVTDDFPIIQNVANTVSQSLANSRLYESLQQELSERRRAEEAVLRRNEELAALNRITGQAGTMLDPRALLQAVTSEVVQLFHARNCGIALLNPERTHLRVVADSSWSASGPHTTGMLIPLEGNEVTRQVMETGQPVIVADAALDPAMGQAQEAMQQLQTHSMMIIPLRVRSDVLGTIALDADDPERRFTEREAELGQTIAAQIAGTLENARLFEQTQAHASEMESSLKEKEVLLKEIHHRVKNNLQVVISLLNLESGRIKDKEMIEILKESQTRIRSMALIHEKLYQSKDFSRVDFDGYVRNLASYLFRTYKASSGAIELEVEVHDVFLGIDRAIPCGLIINELVTNSLKYAFPEGRSGRIKVELHPLPSSDIMLRISDNGVGFSADLDIENTESLGMSLVTTLTNQLGGKLVWDGSQGASFTITFPC